MEIAGKIIVVTGGGSGMGKETALYLSEKGAKVAILDLELGTAKSTAAQINGIALQCNVANAQEVENAIEQIEQEFGAIHVCLNCAGIAPAKRIVGKEGPMPLVDFEKVISVNLIGTFNVLRVAAAKMSKLAPIGEDQERGVIINTASIAAFDGQIGQAAYSASKGGVCALTLPAARELAQHNIRVVTIAPGIIQTPLLEGLPQEVQDRLIANIPFPPRFGHSKEFARLACHIIENAYLNGEVIRLDGAIRMPAR